MVNKNEPVQIKELPIVEESANHFIESHPKDAVELHRSSIIKQEEVAEVATKNKPKDNKKGKKSDETPASPKAKANVEEKSVAVAEKPAKKKKNENVLHFELANQNSGFMDEENETGALIRQLGKADLTRNQIQILIDFLLNKQQDTIIKEPTEWLEGKADVVQKLKKQLQEKEDLLQHEQTAVAGLHAKLRELRNELNTEKAQFNMTLKHHMEEVNAKNMEIRNLSAEMQMMNEKFSAEKQNFSQQFASVQAKYMQIKNENMKIPEHLQTIQQLTETHQLLQQGEWKFQFKNVL